MGKRLNHLEKMLQQRKEKEEKKKDEEYRVVAENIVNACVKGVEIWMKMNKPSPTTRRLLSDDIQGLFLIQTWHGTWLVPKLEQNTVECVNEKPSPESAWTIVKWGDKVVFQCGQSSVRYLRHDIVNKVFNLTPRPLDWETFVPQKNASGSFSFQSHHDLWIEVNEDMSITAADRSNYFTHVFLVDI